MSTKLKLTYLLLGFISLGLIILNLLLHHQPPKLVATNPISNSANILLVTPIKLKFSKPINLQDVRLESSPKETFTPSQPQPNTLIFKHQLPFYQNKPYTINVYYRQKLIYTLHFTTVKSQNEPRQLQLLEQQTKRDYPLAQDTPYNTNQFEVVYIAPKTLQITLKQTNLNHNLILNQVRQWVKNHGQDPNSHQYVFKQLQPYRSTI